MIIDVKKYVFIGVQEDLDIFFKRAQEKGFIEFLSPKGKKAVDYPDSLQNIIQSLRILSKQPKLNQEEVIKDLDAKDLVETVIENKNYLEKLIEEKRLLKAEIERITPLGDFSISDIRDLENQSNWHIQFFCVKQSKLKSTCSPEELIHINTEYDMEYFMSVSKKVESYYGMIEVHFNKSLSQLQKEYNYVLDSIKKCENELKENSIYIDFLKDHLAIELNRYNLKFASSEISTHLNNYLFAVEGWIPKNRLYGLFPLLEGLGIHAEEVAIEGEKYIPTYMENTGYGKVGEQLVHIYDTPATNDKDPSSWVFWAFSIFFAMIISDAGYGSIFLCLALFLKKKFTDVSVNIKLFFRLFKVLSVTCIIWGILANSYFGIDISPKNPLQKVSLIYYLTVKKATYHITHEDETYKEIITKFPQVKGITDGKELLQEANELKGGFIKYTIMDEFRDSIFMELALLIGVLHISFSLLRHVPRAFAGVGWIFSILGGYLFFPKTLNSTSIIHFTNFISKHVGYEVGQQLLWGGIILAILLAVIQHRWSGLIELAKPIELFADILSYLRIYALGLAAMILASTFNEMGMNLGFVAGFFVILVGHAINIVVGIMGGTIHGLRLNFIEWYHHSFSGGGRIFDPLKLLKCKGD